jgi:hypothetical protein
MKRNLAAVVLAIAVAGALVFSGSRHSMSREMPVGRIDRIKGSVVVETGKGRKEPGRAGLPLFPGDEIMTGEDAKVWFSLGRSGQFVLGDQAQVSVDELSASEAGDSNPVLRLILGRLSNMIQRLKEKAGGFRLHTPTAVVGIRGTRFDAVVSLDGTSVIVVDEGSVEVAVDDQKTTVAKGQMTEVAIGERPALPSPAIPREQRDWRAWRKKRIRLFFKRLPRTAPRFRQRFEEGGQRFTEFSLRVQQAGRDLEATMKRARQARMEKNRPRLRRSLMTLKARVKRFKRMTGHFRRALNRVRAVGKFSLRVERAVAKNRGRFTPHQLAVIDSNLSAIAQKRELMRTSARRTVVMIRRTYQELIAFRNELGANRGPAGH